MSVITRSALLRSAAVVVLVFVALLGFRVWSARTSLSPGPAATDRATASAPAGPLRRRHRRGRSGPYRARERGRGPEAAARDDRRRGRPGRRGQRRRPRSAARERPALAVVGAGGGGAGVDARAVPQRRPRPVRGSDRGGRPRPRRLWDGPGCRRLRQRRLGRPVRHRRRPQRACSRTSAADSTM